MIIKNLIRFHLSENSKKQMSNSLLDLNTLKRKDIPLLSKLLKGQQILKQFDLTQLRQRYQEVLYISNYLNDDTQKEFQYMSWQLNNWKGDAKQITQFIFQQILNSFVHINADGIIIDSSKCYKYCRNNSR